MTEDRSCASAGHVVQPSLIVHFSLSFIKHFSTKIYNLQKSSTSPLSFMISSRLLMGKEINKNINICENGRERENENIKI